MQKTILVVGGAGYIGSHVNLLLHRQGYSTLVFDNLSRGSRQAVVAGDFVEGDLSHPDDLQKLFSNNRIDAVMHFAALTDVGESVVMPMKYYRSNVANSLNLFQAMLKHDVKVMIFSSSAAIFGMPQGALIDEEHPCQPINPYGRSKLMVEEMLRDFAQAYGLKSSCLRYFNAAGWDPDGLIPYWPRKEANLIPKVFASLAVEPAKVTLYGVDYATPDGTCLRDYIHVSDLAEAHVLAMEQLWKIPDSTTYNLGNVHGYSVREVVAAIEEVSGKRLEVLEGPRRAGDPPQLIANAGKARRLLGWKPRYHALHDILQHTWHAMRPFIC